MSIDIFSTFDTLNCCHSDNNKTELKLQLNSNYYNYE